MYNAVLLGMMSCRVVESVTEKGTDLSTFGIELQCRFLLLSYFQFPRCLSLAKSCQYLTSVTIRFY